MTGWRGFAGAFLARWSEAACATRAAALAYYTVFSLAPILIIVVAIASAFADEKAVTAALVAEVRRMIGNEGATLVGTMLASARESPRGLYAVVALAVLLVGATTVFAELKDSLDAVFRTTRPVASNWWQWVRARLLSFGLLVTLAFLLLVALVANAALRAGTSFAAAALGWENAVLLNLASEAFSIAGAFALFAVIYRVLPDRRLTGRQWLAATALTTVLFNIGRIAIGIYLGQSELSLAFGPVASLAVLMAWVYYATLAFLAGAVLAAATDSAQVNKPLTEQQSAHLRDAAA